MVVGMSAISSLPLPVEEGSAFNIEVRLYFEAVITTTSGLPSSTKPSPTVRRRKGARASRLAHPGNSRLKLATILDRAKLSKALTSLPPTLDD